MKKFCVYIKFYKVLPGFAGVADRILQTVVKFSKLMFADSLFKFDVKAKQT